MALEMPVADPLPTLAQGFKLVPDQAWSGARRTADDNEHTHLTGHNERVFAHLATNGEPIC